METSFKFTKGDDISSMPQEVKDIAKVVFTKEIVKEYKQSLK